MNEIQSWRDIEAPESLRVRVLEGPPAAHRTGVKSPWLWRTAVAAACVPLVVVTAMLPQSSSAAASLNRLIAGQERAKVMFRIVPFWVVKGARTPKIWSGYVSGHRWRYVQSDMEQAFDGDRTITYFHSQEFATSESGSERGSGNILGTADLSAWKMVDPKNLTLDRETFWNGRKVDKYTVRFAFRGEDGKKREGTSMLLADPERNLPLYQEDIYSPSKGNALEWQYIVPPKEELLRIKLPAGAQVRETDFKTDRRDQPTKARAKGRR